MTVFLGVYKAIYGYESQADGELSIDEGDFLYLLEKSEFDDWWSVKKRAIGADVNEPVGLVPNNYIREAEVLYQVRALYDYEEVQNPEEELPFNEGDVFDIYDDRDKDWLLSRAVKENSFGFVPGNYVERYDGTSLAVKKRTPGVESVAEPVEKTESMNFGVSKSSLSPGFEREKNLKTLSITSAAEPIAEVTRQEVSSEICNNRPLPKLPSRTELLKSDFEEDVLPPHPNKPEVGNGKAGDSNAEVSNPHSDFSLAWDVKEVKGFKKKNAVLKLVDRFIIFCPENGESQQWSVDDLLSYDNEKKHLFLELRNPNFSLELRIASTDIALAIKSSINEWRVAYSGLVHCGPAAAIAGFKKKGIAKYNFVGESADELSVKKGENVYILDDNKSQDWWMCEKVLDGNKGVIPAKFIDVIPKKSTSKYFALPDINYSKDRFNSKVFNISSWKQDVDQDNAKSKKKEDKKKLLEKNSRIWVDRTKKFKVQAEFLGFFDGKIHLHKVNGVKIAVAAEKLSIEDLIYIEGVTGKSLEKYKTQNPVKQFQSSLKDNEDKRLSKIRNAEENEHNRKVFQRELQDLRKAKQLLDQEREKLKNMNHMNNNLGSNKKKYDWFEFFSNCGVDVSNCRSYSLIFEREQISEELLPNLSAATLRVLEIREGDIIRVIKFLDKKYCRNINQVDSNSDASYQKKKDDGIRQSQVANDDDAWTVKPAANSEFSQPQAKKEFSGSLQDLLDIKPLEPKKDVSKPKINDLKPIDMSTNSRQEAGTSFFSIPLSTSLDPFKTGGQNVLPMTTGGVVLMPVVTGSLVHTNGTTSSTMPQTTFGTKFAGNVLPVQKTANGLIPIPCVTAIQPQTTFHSLILPQTLTGGIENLQRTGSSIATQPLMPQTTFGTNPMFQTLTGGVGSLQRTGNTLNNQGAFPQTTFGMTDMSQALTGGTMTMQPIIAQTTFVSQPILQNQGSFDNSQVNQAFTGGMLPLQRTGGLTLSQSIPETTFGFMPTEQSMTGYSRGNMQNTLLQSQPHFSIGTQANENTNSLQTSFGSNDLETNSFQNINMHQASLQNQPTGFGFGNGPQVMKRQANLYNASAANPFGF